MKTLTAKNEVATSGQRLSLPLESLHTTRDTDHKLMINLSHSIATGGMLQPIIVWDCDVADWLVWANPVPELHRPPTEMIKNPTMRVLLVKCGNNRVEYARIMGYEAIDCILTPNKEETSRLCTTLRNEPWS